MYKEQLPDLRHKIIYIYLTDREHETAIADPRFEVHNGRLFLVGQVPDGGSPNDWLAGLVTYVAWDQVQEFIVFDTMEDFHMRLARAWTDDRSWH